MKRLLLAVPFLLGALWCASPPIPIDSQSAFDGSDHPGRDASTSDNGIPSGPLSDQWQRLYVSPYYNPEAFDFEVWSPNDFSLLVNKMRENGVPHDGVILQVRQQGNQRVTREVFRHEAQRPMYTYHLPDGTFFVDSVVNMSRDYSLAYWVDLDGTAHPVLNCMWTGQFSRPTRNPDGSYQTLVGLPCNMWEAYPGQKACISGTTALIKTKPGTVPEVTCIKAQVGYPWYVTEDGRSAIQLHGPYTELGFAADGGVKKWGPHAVDVGFGRGGASVIPPQQRWIIAPSA